MKKFLKKFLSPAFIIFCIIGVINTLVHLSVYNLLLGTHTLIANTVAFIVASIFSYWANSTFTYKTKMNHHSFLASMLTFLGKLLLSNLLTLGFEWLFIRMNQENLIKLIPIPVTIIILPMQFLVFNRIFIPKTTSEPDDI